MSRSDFETTGATMRDIDEYVALVQSAYRGESSRAGWTTEAQLLTGARLNAELAGATIADPGSAVLLLRTRPAGALRACVQITDEGAHVAYLGTLAVEPRRQGTGIGSRLISIAEGYARREFGADTVRLTVLRQRSDLIAFYRRRGYAPTGRTEPFPYGDTRVGTPLRDDLEFVELKKRICDALTHVDDPAGDA
ncbi:GNAT family N-acetyltransferase [Spelaeicoccus albus]|uniref:GNAT superfamily N-acetyltransferase n=1 Tax=Spelaeicoccus albus TaxID=1280376 RepID=A0A7Z0D4B9_9MICO|nr:GNAT family N-acetyltransferase [Spelaeicoccus albus]NYI68639.1 GNAT superfamily N-acetyltransferase [Spelaeicoccus albus]